MSLGKLGADSQNLKRSDERCGWQDQGGNQDTGVVSGSGLTVMAYLEVSDQVMEHQTCYTENRPH